MKYLIISIFAARKCGLKVISKLGIKDKKKSTPFGVLLFCRPARVEVLKTTVRCEQHSVKYKIVLVEMKGLLYNVKV